MKSTTVSFCLTSANDSVKLDVRAALAVNSIPVRYPSNMIDVEKYPYLRDLDVPILSSDVRVDILIDMDNADALMPLEGAVTNRNACRTLRVLYSGGH